MISGRNHLLLETLQPVPTEEWLHSAPVLPLRFEPPSRTRQALYGVVLTMPDRDAAKGLSSKLSFLPTRFDLNTHTYAVHTCLLDVFRAGKAFGLVDIYDAAIGQRQATRTDTQGAVGVVFACSGDLVSHAGLRLASESSMLRWTQSSRSTFNSQMLSSSG